MGADAAAEAADRQEAFRELVERHSRMVFRVAFRITGNEQDAEDVVQETFLKAHRNLERYDSRASFSTWLFRIASNCAIDVLRAKKRRQETPGDVEEPIPSSDPSPQTSALGSEIGSHLSRALAELTPQERTAFVLRHFEGEPIEEIAKALGVRSNAAKQTVFRAVRKLRLRLEPLREAAP
jgi:RNA polymerase sigma-70 factor (ECF subfamily)